MSARTILQAAIMAALSGVDARAFDAPPVRAALPYLLIDEPALQDWSTKTWSGLEGRIAVIGFDGGERPTRLRALADAVDGALAAMPETLGEGWQLASMRALRSRIVRTAPDRWQSTSEFWVRVYHLN